MRLGAAAAALVAQLVVAWAVLRLGIPAEAGPRRLMAFYAVALAVFAVGALLVRRLPVRSSLALALAGGAALQVLAVGFAPTTTDDFYRYIWDGKVQAAGISPYRHPPLDPALAGLRDDYLFPPDRRTPAEAAAAVETGRTDPCTTRGVPHDCTLINRPSVHTIYPPVAEAAFLALHHVSPAEHRERVLQAAIGLLAVATSVALVWALRRAGRDPRAVVLWAWCPVVWLEAGNNAHIDVLGILLMVGTLGLLAGSHAAQSVTNRRLVAAGALFGAAVAVKLVPVLIGPALLVRRARLLVAAAAAVFVAGYVPHVATVGTKVVGYLPGYLREEGYEGSQRFGVPRLLVPDALAPAVAVAVLAAVALLVWRRAATHPPADGALVLAGTAFVLVGPSQPWYGLLIVALVVLADRPEWIVVAAAAYPVYQSGLLGVENDVMQQRAYLPAAIVVAVVALARTAARRRRPAPVPEPVSARPAA